MSKLNWNVIKRVMGIPVRVAQAELEELKSLNITEQDTEQGKAIALQVYSVCAIYGIPLPAAAQEVISRVAAYGVRDAKDGIKSPDKLIIGRVVHEFKDIFKKKYNK